MAVTVERKLRIIIWTPELDAYVADRLDHRKTFSQIAKELGISRCAIIGRVHRLKRRMK